MRVHIQNHQNQEWDQPINLQLKLLQLHLSLNLLNQLHLVIFMVKQRIFGSQMKKKEKIQVSIIVIESYLC
jgi:hypothetical protein